MCQRATKRKEMRTEPGKHFIWLDLVLDFALRARVHLILCLSLIISLSLVAVDAMLRCSEYA